MSDLTVMQHPDCPEHIALLTRVYRHPPRRLPSRIQMHAKALIVERRCASCDEVYERSRTSPQQRFCSLECKQRAHKYGRTS